MGTLHETADLVCRLIGSTTYSLWFHPVLSYDTELTLEDADTLQVHVVAANLSVVADSRSSLRYDVSVDVAVRYKFGVTEQELSGILTVAEIGAYLDLLEEIAEHLATPANRRLNMKPSASWTSNEIRYPWIPEHLRLNRQYTGILRANYRVSKGL